MHQYLETVRTEIEAASGEEAYLASALFWRAHKGMGYEDDGQKRLTDKAGYDQVQNQVINSLRLQEDFDLSEEILSWQAAVLRHVTKEFYHSWVDYKEQKFAASDIFADGEHCMALEASCEKIGANPTDNYTALLEIEQVLIKLCSGPNTMIRELDRFWHFKQAITERGETINLFTQKRIDAERESLTLSAAIRQIESVSARMRSNGKRLAGSHHLLWMNAHLMLESILVVLEAFLDFERIEDIDLAMNHWLDRLFPARLKGGDPNLLHQSPLHHQVIARMAQATQCMLNHVVRKEDSFGQRDEIIIPFIKDVLEQVKRTSLQNIQVITDMELEGSAQR